jgi:hypothetical protein
MKPTNPYLTRCSYCGGATSKQYARHHFGHCKRCLTGEDRYENREAFIIDHGYQAYAREEGHYDLPDNY